MLTIRLTRVGRKNDPSFRVIVIDSKRKVQAGNYLEMLGSYDPRQDRVELKADRIKHWMQNGAQVSDTVHNLLVSQKIIDAKKINILPKFKAAPVETAPAAEAVTPAEAQDTNNETQKEIAVEAASSEAKGDNEVVEETPAE